MDPITLGGIGIASSLASGGVGAISAIEGGNAKSDMYKYRAGVAQVNAQVAKQNADYARASGEKEALQYGIKARQQMGKIVSGQADSGFDVNRGSNVDVREGQQASFQTDLTQIRENAARRAYAFDVEAANKTSEGQLLDMSAKNAKREGRLGAVTSILGAVSSVSSKWLQGNQLGMWGGSSNPRHPYEIALDHLGA